MNLRVVLLMSCVWRAVSIAESAGQQKKCFAPVTCSVNDGKTMSPEWMQVYPFLGCNSCKSQTCSDTTKSTSEGTAFPSTNSPRPDLDLESIRLVVEDMFPRYYAGKTFIPLLHEYVKKEDAVPRCRAIGGELANIYDQKHMEKVVTYVRANGNFSVPHERTEGTSGLQSILLTLGITYNAANRKIVLRNGTEFSANTLKWGPTFPMGDGKYVYLVIVTSEEAGEWQYLINTKRETDGFPLCEI